MSVLGNGCGSGDRKKTNLRLNFAYDKYSILADICFVVGGVCGPDGGVCESRSQGCEFGSGDCDTDGRDLTYYLGDSFVAGEWEWMAELDAFQLVIPDLVGDSDRIILAFLLPGFAIGKGVGGECDRQGKYRIHHIPFFFLFAGAVDREGADRCCNDLWWHAGAYLEIA